MGVDLTRTVFLGLTTQTWITVGMSAIGLMVSLLAFTRTWRHRPSATVLFVPFEDLTAPGLPPFMAMNENRDFGYPVCAGYLMNAGDGDAYMVDLDFSGYGAFLYEMTEQDGRKALLGFQAIPRLTREPMKQFVVIWHPGPKPIDISDYVGVHWTEQPTRLHKCRYQRLSLRKIPSSTIHRESKSRIHRALNWLGNRFGHRLYHHPRK